MNTARLVIRDGFRPPPPGKKGDGDGTAKINRLFGEPVTRGDPHRWAVGWATYWHIASLSPRRRSGDGQSRVVPVGRVAVAARAAAGVRRRSGFGLEKAETETDSRRHTEFTRHPKMPDGNSSGSRRATTGTPG